LVVKSIISDKGYSNGSSDSPPKKYRADIYRAFYQRRVLHDALLNSKDNKALFYATLLQSLVQSLRAKPTTIAAEEYNSTTTTGNPDFVKRSDPILAIWFESNGLSLEKIFDCNGRTYILYAHHDESTKLVP
jgi:hypothetical protein